MALWGNAESAKELLEVADANLYFAKNAGRNQVWPARAAVPRSATAKASAGARPVPA